MILCCCFRSAFAGFDAEAVAKFTEKQIASISSEYGLDLGRVRGVVDNSNRILEVYNLYPNNFLVTFGSSISNFILKL